MKASVLIVDDEEGLRRALGDRLRFWGHEVTEAGSGQEALTLAARRAFDLVLLDLAMPGLDGLQVLARLREGECRADVIMLTAHGSIEKAVEAIRMGARDFLTKPADFDLLQRAIERCLEGRRLTRVNQALAARAPRLVTGPSAGMRALLDTAERAAASDATILLCGESGTGKQVVAEHIHAHSHRRDGPFVYVNCVAISDDLVESTLFGHERGAFTGAVARKPGRLEAAADGTAFLDEIGDISPGLQTKLLHFLESGQFERVGGSQTVTVDCRVVAATNRDLELEMREGRFREDLYYRLNVIGLAVPPLRRRPEDIPVLAEAFLAGFAADLKRGPLRLAARTLEIMAAYPWPGNVRQLRNAVERMAVLAGDDTLTPDLLPPEVLAGPGEQELLADDLPYREAMAAFKRRVVRSALARAGGNQTKAAAALGLERTYLNRLLKEIDGRD